MDDKLNRFVRIESEKEADRIMEEVNSDPGMHNVKAPEDIHEKLFAQIREYEANKVQPGLSEEQKELIELGKVYKRRRKWTKWIVLAAVLVMGMMFGITSMGGPEKVVEKVKWMLGGREQTNIDSDNERVKKSDGVNEVEAYRRVEDMFGFYPVKLYYLPKGIEFSESIIYNDTQTIQFVYEQENGEVLMYIMCPNHRVGSVGTNMEDTLIEEYTTKVEEADIIVKCYHVEEDDTKRWTVEFEYQNVFYLMRINNGESTEVEKIIDNLYFYK